MIEPGFVFPTLTLVALATWLPAVAFALIMIFRPHPRQAAGFRLRPYRSRSCAPSVCWSGTGTCTHRSILRRWVASGDLTIPFGLLLDPLSLLMFTVVATISFLVQIYSLGYMAGDPGFGRYYGCMSLFAWAMLTLTVSARCCSFTSSGNWWGWPPTCSSGSGSTSSAPAKPAKRPL